MTASYMRAKIFSNNKLKLYYWLLPAFIELVEKEKNSFKEVCERLKNKISRPYHKALVKATLINHFCDDFLSLTSGVEFLRPPKRQLFKEILDFPNKCEGCLKEPIQEEAHIIQYAGGKNIKAIDNYLNHYANLWLLCGTCHNIVDNKGEPASIERKEKVTLNLLRRKVIHTKMYQLLRDDRMFIKNKKKELQKALKLNQEKCAKEINKIIKNLTYNQSFK